MEEKLTTEEQATLEWIASEGKPVHVRRACLLLLWDQGLAPKDIGPQVGLSAGRVRYWLRAFRERRMDVFPAALLAAATTLAESLVVKEALVEPTIEVTVEAERPEITVEELCHQYGVDMAHDSHAAEMALALSDLTAEVHGLPPQRRDLLETAGILHNVGFAFYPDQHHTMGRDIILEYRLVELEEVEQQIVACTTAFHRKKF